MDVGNISFEINKFKFKTYSIININYTWLTSVIMIKYQMTQKYPAPTLIVLIFLLGLVSCHATEKYEAQHIPAQHADDGKVILNGNFSTQVLN